VCVQSASVVRAPHGAFTVANGWLTGHTIEMEADKKLVQSWHAKDWPANHYSLCTFTFQDGMRLMALLQL
jgi:activator of HSP90 ATPase